MRFRIIFLALVVAILAGGLALADTGVPYVGYINTDFYEDIWLEGETPTLFSCGGIGNYNSGFNPDSDTDANGETTFTTSLAGGGWTEGPVWVYLNGNRAMGPDWIVHPPVSLRMNSADISGDGQVNLVDVAYFAENFFGEYHYRCDFYWDGVLNLSDLGKLAQGIGHNCE